MKVLEFIKQLQQCDPNQEVLVISKWHEDVYYNLVGETSDPIITHVNGSFDGCGKSVLAISGRRCSGIILDDIIYFEDERHES